MQGEKRFKNVQCLDHKLPTKAHKYKCSSYIIAATLKLYQVWT